MKIHQLEKWVFMSVIMSNILISRTKDENDTNTCDLITHDITFLEYGSCHLRSKLFDITGTFDGVIKIFGYKCK